ncbi:unannotated protein [freshwater metagenome]|uniref:Unannotated protein n=1 Tax=freshwater metagenome TaxID=449393 RepID=A0A6J6E9I1_9ZZZZ
MPLNVSVVWAGFLSNFVVLFMENLRNRLLVIDATVIDFMDRVGIGFLRFAIGAVFIWFGALKTVGELSPAYELVAATVYWLTPEIIVPLLGLWEIAIGLAFLFTPLTRVAIFLLALQMPGTFLPLVLLPEVCFTIFPVALTIEGQYIVKNLVIIGAALVIGSRVQALSNSKRSAQS